MAINPFISRIPNSLKKEFEDEITREIVNMKIQLLNKDENGEQEYNILDRYQIFVTYIRKPVCWKICLTTNVSFVVKMEWNRYIYHVGCHQ